MHVISGHPPAAQTVLTLCLALAAVLAAPVAIAREVPKPALRSSAVLVFDEHSAETLLSKQSGTPSPIASITKLMTALVVLDADQPLDEMLTVTREDVAIGKGTASRVAVGTRLTRGDLLHLALMASENRAAHAVGRNYPGGLPALVTAMNAKSRALGMTQSRFVDPTGLSSQNVASPDDLAKLILAASENPHIRSYSTDKRHTVVVKRRQLEFHNTNSLVAKPDWDIIAQKTGYIAEAGRCLVMKAMIRGRSIVMVLLDSYGKYTRVADAKRVRDWLELTLPPVVAAAG
jgi:serine-type D-Ala-D-Ala endopeptidase (penicillin-binding protein 7)